MISLLESISDFGISTILAGIFIWQSMTSNKQIEKTLGEIRQMNDNQRASLEIIRTNQLEHLETSRRIEAEVGKIKRKTGSE